MRAAVIVPPISCRRVCPAASASTGDIASYGWVSDSGVSIPNGVAPTADFPVGTHNVTLTVTETGTGSTDTDTVVVTVKAKRGGKPGS